MLESWLRPADRDKKKSNADETKNITLLYLLLRRGSGGGRIDTATWRVPRGQQRGSGHGGFRAVGGSCRLALES